MAKKPVVKKTPAKKPAAKKPAPSPASETGIPVILGPNTSDNIVVGGHGITDPGSSLGVKSKNPDGITDPGTTLDSN